MAKTKIVDKNALSQYTEEMKGYIKSQGLGLTEEDINGLIDIKLVPVNETIEDKVDKVDGMGLSTNDFTDEEKVKLDSIPSDAKFTDTVYDDTELKELIADNTEAINAHKTAIDEIKNADTGILKTAKDYADEKVKTLADGQVKTNTDAIATLNGADTEDGSVAKAVKDSADAINAKIGTLADLDTTAKTDLVGAINEVLQSVEAGGTGSVVTMTTDTTTEGYLKTYTFKQGNTEIGKVDIPKDLVIQSGEIVVDPDGQPVGTYLKLTIANQTTPVFVNVKDLVDAYTAQANASQVQLVVSDTNEISATIVAGSIGTTELADNAVNTAKIADDAKALFDLSGSAADALADAKDYTDEQLANITAITEDEINNLFSV